MPAIGRPAPRVLAGVVIASAAALIATVIWVAGPEPPPNGDAELVRVGVVPGQSVPAYLESARAELALLPPEPVWALVTFSVYLPPDDLVAALAGVTLAEVYARVPPGGGDRTPVVRLSARRVPEDVVAGMLGTAQRRDQEEADYRQLAQGLTGGGPTVARLRRAYVSAAQAAAREAAAYRAHCACVFAAVVRARPVALREVAGRGPVRAVDPAPEVDRPERVEFRPPLPEDRDTVPADTPSAPVPGPPGASTVAPAVPAPLPSSSGAAVRSASSIDTGARSRPSVPAGREPAVPSARSPSGTPAPLPAGGRASRRA